jgi:hypothetical protein
MVFLAAANSEDAFWTQLLVVVILAAGAGVYSLVKTRAKRVKRYAADRTIETLVEPFVPSMVEGLIEPQQKRNLSGGMELLSRDFLVSVVEHPDSADKRDITMRILCFSELVRRDELWSVASSALKVYTLDEDGFYGKKVRLEAMKELSQRTGSAPQDAAVEQAVNTARESHE